MLEYKQLASSAPQSDAYDETLLHKPAIQGNLGAVSILLELKGGIEAKNRYGQTPLYLAVYAGNLE